LRGGGVKQNHDMDPTGKGPLAAEPRLKSQRLWPVLNPARHAKHFGKVELDADKPKSLPRINRLTNPLG